MNQEDRALVALLEALKSRDYDFVTPTPTTHALFLEKGPARARALRDALGWSLPFDEDVVAPHIFDLLKAGGALIPQRLGWKSRYRVSGLHGRLYLHSAYPTEDEDAVFFGPDSYRFADFIRAEVDEEPALVADVGAGAGVGGLTVAERASRARIVLSDINPKALRLARINAAAAGMTVETTRAEGCGGLPEGLDLILANPPYLVDGKQRAYRHGGGLHGEALSLTWARQAVDRLRPGGRFLLYTGSAIVEGRDRLKAALAAVEGARLSYRELDPDVFGDELSRPPYAGVERLALVGAVLTRI